MNFDEILSWLLETDARRLGDLWERADAVRRQNVGDQVHLRGLVEFSNICARQCGYCGLRAGNSKIKRYRMPPDEILDCARRATAFGYGTLVLQSGEDRGVERETLSEIIRRVKAETDLAVTLSVGERDDDELIEWKEAGADRYLLRFETSDPQLYASIHPDLPGRISDRIAMLRRLREFGYEVGSGIMIGIPGQTYESLARDIALFDDLDLDMIGVGPYLSHPDTPLGAFAESLRAPEGVQVPATETMTYKVIALTRLVRPLSNIPSTTALATINRINGRELGLRRGANVVMPNLTPTRYRADYQIYPDKACIAEGDSACNHCLLGRIASIGRTTGDGRGDSPNRLRREKGLMATWR